MFSFDDSDELKAEVEANFVKWYSQECGTEEQGGKVLDKLKEIYKAAWEKEYSDRYAEEEDEYEGEGDTFIEKVVRFGGSDIWHAVSLENPAATYCYRPIGETDVEKSLDGKDRLCRKCLKLWELGSARTEIEATLCADTSKTLSELNPHDLDRSYIRRELQKFIDRGEAHICAMRLRTHQNLYRKGPKAQCPDPKYHGH